MPNREIRKKLDVIRAAPSPPGIRVPFGGSSCNVCMYVAENGTECLNANYVGAKYTGKRSGDPRFVDGKTAEVITDPREFCCNMFDWEET